MADEKLTDLTALTTLADGDFQYLVDVSDTTDDAAGTSKKITLATLREYMFPLVVLTKSSTVNQNVGGANGTEVYWTWDGQTTVDATYTHSTSTNPSRITVNATGIYEVCFIGGAQTTGSARTTLQGIYRINGGSTLRGGSLRNYTRGAAYGNITTGLIYTLSLTSGDYIEVGTRVEDSDGSYTINTSGGEISDDCHQFRMMRLQ